MALAFTQWRGNLCVENVPELMNNTIANCSADESSKMEQKKWMHLLSYWVRMYDESLVGGAVWLDDVLVADAAVTCAPLDLHVAAVSPAAAPAVLHQPVVLAALSAVPDNRNLNIDKLK